MTKEQSVQLQQSAYKCMTGGHILSILIWLKKVHLDFLSSVLDYPAGRFPSVTKNQNYFAEWYYDASDNEFNFRNTSEFRDLGSHYDQLFQSIEHMKEFHRSGQTEELKSTLKVFCNHYHSMYDTLNQIRNYLNNANAEKISELQNSGAWD